MKKSYQEISDLFSLLAHTPRLKILDELRRGEACVCHLQAVLDRPQPYISQQLSKLREAELVTDHREGLFIYYRLANPEVEWILESLLGLPRERAPLEKCTCPRCEKRSGKKEDGN